MNIFFVLSDILNNSTLSNVVDFFSLDNVVFTFMGEGVSALEIMSTITGLLCVFLAVKGKVANFWVGYFYNILLFAHHN